MPNWAFNQNPQTFNTLNTFVQKGDGPPRIELCYDALMFAADDEPSAIYGLLAESVTISADRDAYTFALRPEARWHDGTALTAHDAAYTLTTFKADGHPSLALSLKDMVSAEAPDDRTLVVTFDGQQSDRAVLTLAVMPIISKVWNEANGFTDATMEVPLTSGPYRVGRVDAGQTIEYERVADWWGQDLAIARGRNNFDRLRIDFYRERQAAFEAFKKGDIHFRQEFTSKDWETEYDFPAIQEGKVVKRTFESEKVPSFQAWALNTRRDKFADIRTREAIGLAFDFEWTNTNLFYGAYGRAESAFQKSDFQAVGKPSPEELAVLEPLRGTVPDGVFEEALTPPVSDGSGRDRALLRQANTLLEEAGWQRQGRALVDANGTPFTLEILIRSPTFERILGPYVRNLKALGIDASIRLVDPAQFQARMDTFEFDMVGFARSLAATPTVEALQQLFGSDARDVTGSGNLPGIADPAVDALIDAARTADSREALVPVLRALDRVLRLTHTLIPNWYAPNHRVAFWDMFGFPETKPDYAFPVETTWWFDEAKAKAIGRA